MQRVGGARARGRTPVAIALGVPAVLAVSQLGPRPLMLGLWSALGLVLAALVELGVRRHRPTRPLAWHAFALVAALQSPTTTAFVLRDAGWFEPQVMNVLVGAFCLVTSVAAPTAFALLLPPRFWRTQRPAIGLMVVVAVAMLVGVVWRLAQQLSSGTRIVGGSILQADQLGWATAVTCLAALFHAVRCATAKRWSEAALSFFPAAVALSYVPLVLGVGLPTGDRLVMAGSGFGYALVASAALHPSMRSVARVAPTQVADVTLRPVLCFMAANAAAAPLVLGSAAHPWLVPAYALSAGLGAMAWSFGRRRSASARRAVGFDVARNERLRAVGSVVAGPLGDDLRDALFRSELQLHYQPIVRLGDEAVIGAEALLRWEHPRFGWIAPDVVVPLAQHAGLADELADWTLSQALAEGAMLLPLLSGPRPYVAVNISPAQLESPRFVQQVVHRLGQSDTPAVGIVLEITEQEAFEDIDQAVINIGSLQQLGVRVAMDDFGAGNANLPLLGLLEIDVVKLDRSVVAGIASPRGARVLRTMIGLLDDLGVDIVAEGIEIESMGRAVAQLGVGAGQGFGLGRPVGVAELMRWLAEPQPGRLARIERGAPLAAS